MEASYFFVQLLAQNIYACLMGIAILPEIELRQDLIGKRIRHDKARVTCGTAKVYQTTFGQQEDLVAIWEGVFIYPSFDVGALDSFGRVQLVDLNFVIKMSDVRHDGLVLHPLDMFEPDYIEVAGSGDVDVATTKGLFNGSHFVTFHRGLQRIDRIDLRDDDARALTTERLRTTFANITVTTNYCHFPCNHDIERTVYPVNQRMPAAIKVVELRFGDRIIHVNRRDKE